MNRHLLALSAAAFVLAFTTRAEPQDAPPVVTPETECAPATSIWIDGLHDALVDRAPYLCGCAAPAGSWISVAVPVARDGSVGRGTVSASTAMNADASSCVLSRIARAGRNWQQLARPSLDGVRPDRAGEDSLFDFDAIACAQAPTAGARAELSAAFTEAHPHGLRAGAELPRPPCRPHLRAVVNVQLRF